MKFRLVSVPLSIGIVTWKWVRVNYGNDVSVPLSIGIVTGHDEHGRYSGGVSVPLSIGIVTVPKSILTEPA